MTAAVRARGWGWRHPGRRAWAVRGLDLAIDAGERVLLVGGSGSGKSTVLQALAGILVARAVADDPRDAEEGELRVAARRRALLLQDPDAQTVMARVGDDVAFGLENLGTDPALMPGLVSAALAGVGLGGIDPARATSSLSTGQRQRLALAGVLAMAPDLLLLDEPTAMVDPAGALLLRDAVMRHVTTTGATLVVVEHRVDEWVDHVDRAVVLGPAGQGVVADGPPAAVLGSGGPGGDRVWRPVSVPGQVVAPARRGAPLLVAESLAAARPGRPGGKRPGPAVRGIDVTLHSGEAVAITGVNGSGKTTLLHTLAGLVPAAGGRLRAAPPLAAGAGEDPARWRPRQVLTRIQTVFAEPRHQFLERTVRDEVLQGPRRARLPDAATVAEDLLVRLRLDHLAEANPWTLSGGEQRRLSVATALAVRPAVVALDEPTFGQDPRTWAELTRLLTELLARGTAVVTATHDLPFVAALGATRLPLGAR